jgi:hypothetical protein
MDFNKENFSDTEVNAQVNAALDAAALAEQKEAQRTYLGASGIGDECLRKVQFNWKRESVHPARTKRIFARGHMFEEITVKAMAAAGFRMERGTPNTGFSAVDGEFKGHCDGIILEGPSIDGLKYPCLFEHKALGSSSFDKIKKHGLRKGSPAYYDQVQIYQAYLGLDENPALFTIVNANTCDTLHLLIPFDAVAAQAASDRAVMVIKATQKGELLERIAKTPDDFRCKNLCSHKEFCWSLTA